MVAGDVVNTTTAVAEATFCQQHALLQMLCLMGIESPARYTARVLLTGHADLGLLRSERHSASALRLVPYMLPNHCASGDI